MSTEKSTMKRIAIPALAMGLIACDGGHDDLEKPIGASVSSGSSGVVPAPPNPTVCRQQQKHYVGLEDEQLGQTRSDGRIDEQGTPLVLDRHRVKSFEVLQGDLRRLLGATGQTEMEALLNRSVAEFGRADARWFQEPSVTASSLNTLYRVAFRGCTVYSKTVPAWQKQPTQESAKSECAALQAKVWDRLPTTGEIASCAEVATNATAFQQAKVTAASDKWAYTCASVFASVNFIAF
jgi:hypothetical protein